MAKRTAGLRKRGAVWHVDKRIKGYGTLRESTGTTDFAEAERYLAHRLEEIRRVSVYGERPRKTFAEAAERYLTQAKRKQSARSYETTAGALARVFPHIARLHLNEIHDGTLQPWIEEAFEAGLSPGSINRTISVVRRILNLAARKWREGNHAWLATSPLIDFVANNDARRPYPLSWDEQGRLVAELPSHLEQMALFKVNTGTRQQEVCQLRWAWEVDVPELETSVFILPGWLTKNGEERVVVLNKEARRVVDSQRRIDGDGLSVFTYQGHAVGRMNNHAWRKARGRAGLPGLRVHDLKHTFGHRLRAAAVPLERRKSLLGHKGAEITTHYSAPDVAQMIADAELAATGQRTTILRQNSVSRGEETRRASIGA